MTDRTPSRSALWAARLLLPLATLVSAAAEPRKAGSRQLRLSADDFAYYRQSKAIIDNILAGDLSSAEAGSAPLGRTRAAASIGHRRRAQHDMASRMASRGISSLE